MIRILVADDHPVVCLGLRHLLNGQPDSTVVGEAADGRDALTQIANLRPDVLLLGLHMPNLPGLDTRRELADCIRTVVPGGYRLRGRAVTNLVTELETLVRSQRDAPVSRVQLTPREMEVMRQVVIGGTNRDIATQLGITEDTVKRHLTHVFDKTGVSSRLDLALFALKHLGLAVV